MTLQSDLASQARDEIITRELQSRCGDLSPAKRELLEKRLRMHWQTASTVIERRPGDVRFAPLSYGQRALWYLGMFNPESAAYIVFRAWRIFGALDRDKLDWSIAALVRRQEALRSSIRVLEKEPLQIVTAPRERYLEYLDFREDAVEIREQRCLNLMTSQWMSPLNLADEQLFHVHLVQLDDTEHVLLLKLHHAFCDGWSIGVFVQELGRLYKSQITGESLTLPELPIRYGDFTWWQRNQANQRIDDDLAYWVKQLAGAPQLLELPTDKKRPSVQRHRGGRHHFQIDSVLFAQLDGFARRHRLTPFMVLLAAYNIVLCRFSGQQDICVGVPFASRNQPGIENLMGLVVNTVVLRSRINLESTFDACLEDIKQTTIMGFEHAAAPFDLVVEKLGLATNLSHNPLFQTLFVLQSGILREFNLHGLEVENATPGMTHDSSPGNKTSKFDLSLSLSPYSGGLRGTLEYDSDLFKPSTVQRIGEAFLVLLKSALDDSSQRLCHLPLMDDEQGKRIVQAWNTTDRTRVDESVVSRFEYRTICNPDAIALIFQNQEVSYGVLNERANQVASCLQEAGVKRGDRIGLCLDPSIQQIASMLGILKCGALFVPLGFDLPLARLESLVSSAMLSQVLVDQGTTRLFDFMDIGVINAQASATRLLPVPDVELQGRDPAYVLFTSGSTGQPKGVVGTHQGILNRIDWMQDEFPYQDGDCCCHRSSPGFGDAIAEIFAPLLYGIPAIVFSQSERSSPRSLLSALFRYQVTRLTVAPVLLRAMINRPGGIACLKHLKICTCSGEVLPASLWQQFHEQLPDAILLNLYGCTEVAADATWFDCRNAVAGYSIPIGKPIHNTRVYVVDDFMQAQPVGVVGRLLVSGIGLAEGYCNNSELTATTFLANPFADDGGKIYDTGDLARFLADGNLEYLGRADDQINLHGIRIEPGEIESVLARHPAVDSAVVALSGQADQGRRLTAWVVYAPDSRPDAAALRRYLGDYLPQQWIPPRYINLESLPLLAGGKVDRQALPQPDDIRPGVGSDCQSPRSDTEKRLVSIWKKILGVTQIGRTDNFFDLGGHSILVFELLDSVQKEFGPELPLSAVFLFPTISDLAFQIEEYRGSKDRSALVVRVRDGAQQTPFFCVPAAASSVLSIRTLASEFEDGQSFFAIQPLGIDMDSEAQDSIALMAKTYIYGIREQQPTGPYYLGGRCFGGLVAIEMARQLQSEGESIGLLVLLDTSVPGLRLSHLLSHCTVIDGLSLLLKYPFERILARIAGRRIASQTKKQLQMLSSFQATRIRVVDRAHRVARQSFALAPITAPVLWLRSRSRFRALRFGWAPFVKGRFTCINIDGDHFSMFESPHISTLSKQLSRYLIDHQGH